MEAAIFDAENNQETLRRRHIDQQIPSRNTLEDSRASYLKKCPSTREGNPFLSRVRLYGRTVMQKESH